MATTPPGHIKIKFEKFKNLKISINIKNFYEMEDKQHKLDNQNKSIKNFLAQYKPKIKENLVVSIFFLLLILFILLNFSDIKKVLNLIYKANWLFLSIALLCVFLHIFSFSLHLRDVLKKAGEKANVWFLTKIAIAMTFVDTVLPSQRIGGHIFLFKSLRKKEIVKEKRSLVFFISGIANFTVDFIIFLIATIYTVIFIKSNVVKILLLAMTGIFFILYVPIAPFFFSSKGEKYVIGFFRKLPKKWLDKIIKDFSKRAEGVFKGYYKEKKRLKPRDWFMPLLFMLFNRIFLYLTLFFSVLSLNYYISIDKVLIAEILSMGIAFFSFVKIGFFEGALALALTGLSIDYNVALTSTLIFRFLSFWLPTLIGYLFFRQMMKR